MEKSLRSTKAIALSTASALSLLAPTVHAREEPLTWGSYSVGAGVFFGYVFSSVPERAGLEWGLSAFATRHFNEAELVCGSGERSGFGPLIQLGLRGDRDPRLTVAVHGGAELERPVFALDAEVGASYRFGRDSGFSVHLGGSAQSLYLNVALRSQLLRDEVWAGGGLRYLPMFGDIGMCAEGRSLRTGQARCVGEQAPQPSAATDAQLAALQYAAAARMECVSIASFAQLALELRAVGAPNALVHGAWKAAADELRHTHACAEIAVMLGEQPSACPLPVVTLRPASDRQAWLCRLAVESFEDGCVGEAAAAAQIERGARLANDPRVARTLRRVARDEAQHAQLAWDIVQYCLDAGGKPVRAALKACAQRVRRLHWARAAAPDLERFGRVSSADAARLARVHTENAQARLAAL